MGVGEALKLFGRCVFEVGFSEIDYLGSRWLFIGGGRHVVFAGFYRAVAVLGGL